ncbi:MAG: hypothetical protein BWY21_01338 [Parcubacteria group bacterium ADurb.Bin216]|nr:MAG: hypothetical protein BWY21_01338 [Parcubacteria group bacterium ADurb.Bin216]
MLTKDEMQVIENFLIHAGTTIPREEKEEQAILLSNLRKRFKCDNHELHSMYSKQLKEEKNVT